MLSAISTPISTEDQSYRKYISVLDAKMAYVDVGNRDPIVFLHGNPTPSYLWRNIVPHLLPLGSCLAPDYVGMGNSSGVTNCSYRLADHQRYLDAWLEAVGVKNNVVLVVHDWGSALGFSWAQRHPEQIKAIIHMESIVRPFQSWDEWPDATRAFFQALRSPAGEDLILEKNLFIEYLLPLRQIPDEAMEVYRRYSRIPGPSRLPMLAWSRELPIEGKPKDVLRSSIPTRIGYPRVPYPNYSSTPSMARWCSARSATSAELGRISRRSRSREHIFCKRIRLAKWARPSQVLSRRFWPVRSDGGRCPRDERPDNDEITADIACVSRARPSEV